MTKKILYIDMDGVIVDTKSAMDAWFSEHLNIANKYKENPDHIPGIFRFPPPIKGAIESIKKLSESNKYDIFILTSAPWGNPESNTDKRYWIEAYFKKLFHKKLIITHRKDLLMGDYLIDDRLANGADEFTGKLLSFGWDYENNKWNEYPTWNSILKVLL